MKPSADSLAQQKHRWWQANRCEFCTVVPAWCLVGRVLTFAAAIAVTAVQAWGMRTR